MSPPMGECDWLYLQQICRADGGALAIVLAAPSRPQTRSSAALPLIMTPTKADLRLTCINTRISDCGHGPGGVASMG